MCLIHILQRNIDMVFTYDSDGTDEDFLQPAIYDSLTVLVKKNMLPENVAVYSLANSIGVRSILGLYDVPFASFFGYDLISEPMDILILQKLYLLLSTEYPAKSVCQMIFNTCFLYNRITKMNMETASKTVSFFS
ncbi:N-acetylglucosaminyl-phosphatidylinositol de-N-acetylase [Trichinella pseudospiralis]